MLFLKHIFKGPYNAIKTPESRELLKLFFLFGDKKRYNEKTIKFQGFKFKVPDVLSFLFQFQEIFIDNFYKFKNTESEPIIFDCGANIGTSVAYFKSVYPNCKITAFEADPKIAELLELNLTNNNLKDVNIVKKAVWINDFGVEFVSEGSDSNSIFGNGKKIKVPSIRLKETLQSESKISMLKMDIEGAETAVLRDCSDSLSHVENIFIEYHSFTNHPQELDEVLSILKKNGFRYTIQTAHNAKAPLLNNSKDYIFNMDLQVNIFGFR